MDKPTWRIILVKNNTSIIAVLSISQAAFFVSIDLTYVYFCWKTNRTRGGKIRYFEFFEQKDRMKVFQYKAPTSLKMQLCLKAPQQYFARTPQGRAWRNANSNWERTEDKRPSYRLKGNLVITQNSSQKFTDNGLKSSPESTSLQLK